MPKPKKKKHTYTILLTSMVLHVTKIEAYSHEDACKLLQRKVAGKNFDDATLSSVILAESWCDPADNSPEWLVTRDSRSERISRELMAWNGKTIRICQGS